MQSVKLDDLLQSATPYERWRAPLDQGLVRGVALAALSIGIALIALWAVPETPELPRSGFFWVFGSEFRSVLLAVGSSRIALILLDMLSVVTFFVALGLTRGFRVGRAIWHWVSFGVVAIGTANAVVLGIETAILAINLAIWIAIMTAALAGVCITIAGLALLSGNRRRL